MECEIAREALSARMDGEHEPVPARRVDEHLASCPECRQWQDELNSQMDVLRGLIAADRTRMTAVTDSVSQPALPETRDGLDWVRIALAVVGGIQIVLAVLQAAGVSIGVHVGHSMGGHVVNESTAWSVALGVAMLVAADRPAAAMGLAIVGGVFTLVLTGYVVVDGLTGAVGAVRMLSHLPALAGVVLTVLVWRRHTLEPPRPDRDAAPTLDDITLPDNASRGRRRGHLWPTDGNAA
ncbi:zf-HC2 domain-containing protein [Mycolicibacterium mucogenicum]|uniref:zf-HC2 domain-containing protein n=1 Tax=Mycolicibacterium mucogenicum TaxID=56689 RepID=UPI00076A88C9|nr:zf-HC2 domain-containing protein [Mycolicibacterium mucogenicum]